MPVSGNPDGLAALRKRVGAIESASGFEGVSDGPVSIARAVDAGLPWGGLPRGCLHEISGGEAATGFAAALAARLAGGTGGVLWCLRPRAVFDMGDLYGPGLVAFGLKPGQLTFVHAPSEADLLWAMEEGLRSGVPAVVLGEVRGLGLTASRRLQLAAEASGVTALLLHRPAATRAKSSSAVTRWHVASASSNAKNPSPLPSIPLPPCCVGGENAFAGVVRADRKNRTPPPFPPSSKGEGFLSGTTPRWRVDLLRCRGAGPKSWLMDWRQDQIRVVDNEACDANRDSTTNDRESTKTAQAADTGGFTVVAELLNRPAEPAPPLRRAS